jgi:hypothetical protein
MEVARSSWRSAVVNSASTMAALRCSINRRAESHSRAAVLWLLRGGAPRGQWWDVRLVGAA